MPLQKSSHPSSYHQTPNRNKLLSPSQVVFFLKISPPRTKWVEGERVKTMVLNKSQLVSCLETHRKSIHTLFQTWDIRPSGPIWSDLLRVFSVITQNLQFCHLWNLGWEVNYRNDSRFRPSFYKKKYTEPIFKVLFAQI